MSATHAVHGRGIYEKLKKFKPHKLLVKENDGTILEVTVPQDRRQKYEFVMNTLAGIAWTQIDLCGKNGNMLERHVRCPDDHSMVDDGPDSEAQPTGDVDKVAQLMHVMKQGQTDALKMQHEAAREHLALIHRMIEVLLTRFDLQEARFALQEGAHQAAMNRNYQLAEELLKAKLEQVNHPPAQDGAPTRPISDRTVDRLLPVIVKALIERDPEAPKTPTPPLPATAATPPASSAPATGPSHGTTNGVKPPKVRTPVSSAPA